MNTLKSIFIKILISLLKPSWNKDKTKVLIQTNKYLTSNLWLNKFKIEFPHYDDIIDLKFANNKIEFIQLLPEANYCFSYGMSNQVNIDPNTLKFVYYGLVGSESTNNKYESIKKYHPKGISSKAIAEYCLAMVLIMQNNLHKTLKNQRRFFWNQQPVINTKFYSIENKKVFIFGLGQNGQAIAKIFKTNLCYTLGFDIIQTSKNIDEWISKKQINEILPTADIVICSLPLTEKTSNFFNKEKLQLLNKKCIFINISRGALVDEKELIRILKQEKIQGAILDVFKKEPLNYFSPLKNLSNVIITPHISGNINRFKEQIQQNFIHKLISHLNV